jgi:hypothetical protein
MLVDPFFSALRHESLVLLYLKDLPRVEDRVPGEPHLVGAGIVACVDLVVESDYASLQRGDLRSVMQERGVAHPIPPSLADGFVPLPATLAGPGLGGRGPRTAGRKDARRVLLRASRP